ncbi:hemolysin family protein [Cryptosporangium aurantiacum]|uniref:Hemolysin, contains CBS domains n=1 Tax=Cryptosporangium aurantiacum TaxID=134849 RepID=A0A1M7RLM7_9ACTN|nr:hemolysin family protein [Cryptosporangium aurantiacum]SHN46998.1 Hemolysin, contains CBS domains [Cryptosporangium aurantiacum]
MSDWAGVAITVALLLANAFFVAAEFALISARRTTIEPRATAGSRTARITLRAMENVSLMMAGAQLGITVCSLALGAVGEPAIAHLIERPFSALGMPDDLLHPVAFAIALFLVVSLHVVIGEMVPKNIALAGPDRAALLLAPPLVAVVIALKPVIVGLNAIANAVLRLLRVVPKDEITSAFTRDEVADLITESRKAGLLEPAEHTLLTRALTLDERTVGRVALPLTSLVTVERTATLEQVEDLAARTGYSRFPVVDGHGAPIGYLHLKDVVIDTVTDGVPYTATIPDDIVRPLPTVRPDATLREGIAAMRHSGAHLAKLPDGDALVALEDMLEELVGEIHDSAHA